MVIGVAGLGRMGRAFARKIGTAGLPVKVWNRTPGKALGIPGAMEVSSPRVLTDSADIILVSLTDDAAVANVFEGRDGLLEGPCNGRLFIETSTVRPDTIRRLGAVADAAGAALVDSPVAGGPKAVAAAECFAFIGGTELDVDRARPVLAHFARRLEHMGPLGSGTVMKLVANLPIGAYFQALAEALTLGRRHGLDLERMLGVMTDSPGAIKALPPKVPTILGSGGDIAFDIAGVRKDLLAMTTSASLAGVPAPVASAALSAYAAAAAAGWGNRDFAEIVRFWSEAIAGNRE